MLETGKQTGKKRSIIFNFLIFFCCNLVLKRSFLRPINCHLIRQTPPSPQCPKIALSMKKWRMSFSKTKTLMGFQMVFPTFFLPFPLHTPISWAYFGMLKGHTCFYDLIRALSLSFVWGCWQTLSALWIFCYKLPLFNLKLTLSCEKCSCNSKNGNVLA